MAPVFVLACSPRAHGNTDGMAAQFAAGVQAAGGTAEVLYLRDTPVTPCTACGSCRTRGHCVLPDSPTLEGVMGRLRTAPAVCMAIPIFFYHVPAQCKALIDRAQYLWEQQTTDARPQPTRPVIVGMTAGRPRGDKLFAGALRSLRYFFDLCGLSLRDTLLLRGMDQSDALTTDTAASAQCFALGHTLQTTIAAGQRGAAAATLLDAPFHA